MKALFIGGTGNISSACVELALSRGIDVTLLNRGTSGRSVPNGAQILTADIRDPQSVRAALGRRSGYHFVDLIAAVAVQCEQHLARFRSGNRSRGERAPFLMTQQHDDDCVAPLHGGGGFVGKSRFVDKTERAVECHRRLQIGDRHIDENHFGHRASSSQIAAS